MKIAIGVTTYNRRRMVEAHARSLCSARLPSDAELIVVDDASAEYDLAYLRTVFPENANIQRRHENSGGADFAIRDLMERLLATDADALLLLDSDCIVASNFLETALRLLPDSDGVLSLFNTPSHPEVGQRGPFILKESVGSAATLWRNNVAREMVAAVSPGVNWDWRFCDFLISAGYAICVVRHSLVQHIGYALGQNSSYISGDIGIGFSDAYPQNAYSIIEQVAFASQSGLRLSHAQLDALIKRVETVEIKLLESEQALYRIEAVSEQRLLTRIARSMVRLLKLGG